MTRSRICGLLAALVCFGTTAATAQDMPSTPPLAPAIAEIEADWVKGGLRLKAQVVPRGAEVEKVTLRYRKKLFTAKKGKQWTYTRLVAPRGGDGRGDKVRFRVRACTATVCATRTASDEAGG
jgi:hypothetical protein